MESQQKNEAVKKVDALSERVRELELQLESEGQQSHEALEEIHSSEELEMQPQSETKDKIHASEHRVTELEMQLQSEAQQKHEATEKAEWLELRVADLERRLNEQSHVQDGADKQVKSDCLGLGSSSDF